MRITYLVEVADQIWGGVKVVLEDANWLADRGHEVTILSRSGPPAWMTLRCGFQTVPDFAPERVPPSDLIVATFWVTVPAAVVAARAGRGVPVHYCQGYEGDNPENAAHREQIEAVYRLPDVHKVTISPHLSRTLRERFDVDSREIVYTIDEAVMWPANPRTDGGTVRVGLIGPYQIAWKDIATGMQACALAHQAGLDLQLVRATNTTPHPDELAHQLDVEWHERVPPAAMGDLYRSLDVFLGTSRGAEEGFFLPAVEAMACGVPCVLTDIPCFRGYGEGQYALFVEPGNPREMAEALVIASRHPGVRKELRDIGLRVASRYRTDEHGRELEQTFEALARPTARTVAPPAPETLTMSAPPSRPSDAGVAVGGLLTALAETLRNSAELLTSKGDHTRADDLLRAAKLVDGDEASDPDAISRRGLELFARGEFAAAAEAFRAAITAGMDDAETHNNLGVALFQAGNHDAARESFEHALTLDSDHADANANLRSITSPT